MAQYSFRGAVRHSMGLTWAGFSEPHNGMGIVLIIFAVEWPLLLLLAWYLEQVICHLYETMM